MNEDKRPRRSLRDRLDLVITRRSKIGLLEQYAEAASKLAFIETLPFEHASMIVRYLKQSKSQLRQDLFVLSELGFKRDGYFVEFGATDGISLSNTHLLENEFGWRGILAEPARCWHGALHQNRSCHIETACVWTDSTSKLRFNEVEEAELSTIDDFSAKDYHQASRKKGKTYEISTISLVDLLVKHDAPAVMDYLSIDTEGSEFEILNGFDFDRFSFRTITCEHNYSDMRGKIFDLLSRHGYVRKYEELSKFDDWYVKGS